MTALRSRQIQLRAHPINQPGPEHFELVEREVAPPDEGQVRIRNLWMSVDPYMGNRLFDRPSYVPAYRVGRPLDGGSVGTVLESRAPGFKPGDLVFSHYGWREIYCAKPERLTLLDPVLPPAAYLGIAGTTGLTAYTALHRIARIQPGETVYVSAAAGAVGSAACQMARLHGCRVIGSAGGPEKVDFLREIGVDVAIDYKAEADLAAALKAAAPDGIQVYVDNVGGNHLEAALEAMAVFGRIAVSGMISDFGQDGRPGPSNLALIVGKRLRVEGFLLGDHQAEIADTAVAQIAEWMARDAIINRETIHHGIEKAPQALLDLFAGANIGKMLIKLD